jgi:hypothetical protein
MPRQSWHYFQQYCLQAIVVLDEEQIGFRVQDIEKEYWLSQILPDILLCLEQRNFSRGSLNMLRCALQKIRSPQSSSQSKCSQTSQSSKRSTQAQSIKVGQVLERFVFPLHVPSSLVSAERKKCDD